MSWELWAFLGVSCILALYVVLRLLYVLIFCGGISDGDYYGDSQK